MNDGFETLVGRILSQKGLLEGVKEKLIEVDIILWSESGEKHVLKFEVIKNKGFDINI